MIVHDCQLLYSEGELGERTQTPSTVHGPETVKDGGGVGGVGGGGGDGGDGGGETEQVSQVAPSRRRLAIQSRPLLQEPVAACHVHRR